MNFLLSQTINDHTGETNSFENQEDYCEYLQKCSDFVQTKWKYVNKLSNEQPWVINISIVL